MQRLQNVEKRIVRVSGLASGVNGGPSGPRKELVNNHCNEFIELVKMTLLEEIRSTCDYVLRILNEICCKKLEYVIAKLDEMK